VAGLWAAGFYARRLVARESLWTAPAARATDIDDVIVYAALGIVLGGRLGYVLFYNADAYLANPAEILAVWRGGMSFHGGFLGALLALILFARARGCSP
jgi:phosphatidylglycerol:prolipoprotein diacylglycerol transferase